MRQNTCTKKDTTEVLGYVFLLILLCKSCKIDGHSIHLRASSKLCTTRLVHFMVFLFCVI